MRNQEKISYFIALLTTIIRYYDYALFGLSASALASNFMPGLTKADKFLNFFAIFSIAVIARPVGAIIFGHIGDKIGRVASVKLTALIAAISTIMIGLLPDYKTIGILATISLICFRMLFIMSLAGEIDTIKIYISEKVDKKNRHLASGFVSFAAQVGGLIAALMYHITLSFNEIFWLWKINFVIGGIFGLIIFCVRNSIKESSYYLTNKNNYRGGTTIIKILSENKLKILLAVLINGGMGSCYNFLVIFLSLFVSQFIEASSLTQVSKNNVILIIVYGVSCLISGYLADRVSSVYKQIFAGLLLALSLILLMLYLSFYNIFSFSLQLLVVFFVPIFMIPIQIKLQSLFATTIRVRACSLSHSLGSMIFSSTIPFICMLLWKYTNSFSAIYSYFMILLLLIIFSILLIRGKAYRNMFEI